MAVKQILQLVSFLYLIVVPREFAPALTDFVAHKESHGYTVAVEYVDNKPAQDLQSVIREYRPEYVLLIGDVNNGDLSVPSFYSTTGSVTDYYYGVLEDGAEAEVLVGRLPARDIKSAKTMLRNAMYHTYPTNTTIVMEEEEKDIERYSWVLSEYLQGDGLLYENCVLSNTIQLINEGQRFFVYTGHGHYYGSWCHSMRHISRIPFGNYSIVMQLSCHGGNFAHSISYGEEWMSQSGRGAVAFVGSSGLSGYETDSIFFEGMMKSYGEGENVLGKMVLAGRKSLADKMECQLRYNLLGDPSLKVGVFYEAEWSDNLYFPVFMQNNLKNH